MYTSIAEFKAKNKAAGFRFFDPETLRDWDSRIESKMISGRFFITSEGKWSISDLDTKERYFAVRKAEPDGSVETLKSFLLSKEDAVEWIKFYQHAQRRTQR